MSYLLYSIGLFYATLIFYNAVMNIARKKDELDLFQKIIFAPILVVGLILDFLFQHTVGTVLFLEIHKAWLFTDRMKKHVNQDTWRGKIARFLCTKLLDAFDPSGSHC